MTIPYKRVCYLRPEPNFPIDQVIKLQLCTHIIIAFLQFDNKSELIQDPMTNNFIAFCKQTINQFQSNVKLMFSIGGKFLLESFVSIIFNVFFHSRRRW